MGLDTYARHPKPENDEDATYASLSEEEEKAFGRANIALCGGMMSGNGNDGSFRGKVYSGLIQEITGESLYQNWIPPERVRVMADKLDSYDGPPPRAEDDETIPNLRRFFRVCVELNLGLVGWW